MRIPTAFAYFLLLAAAPAFAGETYTFHLQSQGDAMEISRKGRVQVDGERYRVQLDEPGDPSFPYDVLLSTDGGRTETGLFPDRRTYYGVKEGWKGFESSIFGLAGMLERRTLKNIQVAVIEDPEPEVIAGLSARRKEIRLSYDIQASLLQEKLQGRITMEAVYWLAEAPGRSVPTLLRPQIKTGLEDLDKLLREPLSRLQGLPVRQRITVTSEGKDLPRRVATYTVDLSTVESAPPPAGAFEIPKGFRFEEPEISVPILGKRDG